MNEAINAYFSVYTAVFTWIADHILIIIATLGIPLMILGVFLIIYSIPLLFVIAALFEALKWLAMVITGRKYE